jgi:hypothetical protein
MCDRRCHPSAAQECPRASDIVDGGRAGAGTRALATEKHRGMMRLLRTRRARVPDLRSVARSLKSLREKFRQGELAWDEYILHGSAPHSLSAVDERRFRKANRQSPSS